jgi:hypothetical protein
VLQHEAFQPPEPPISYSVIASAMNASAATVKALCAAFRRESSGPVWLSYGGTTEGLRGAYHSLIAKARREGSRRWGRRMWIARFRRQYGRSPWE